MTAEETLKRLARRGREDAAPQVDVTARVMAAVRVRSRNRPSDDRPLAWVAVIAAVVAIPAALVAQAAWQSWEDPFAAMLADIPWEMLI